MTSQSTLVGVHIPFCYGYLLHPVTHSVARGVVLTAGSVLSALAPSQTSFAGVPSNQPLEINTICVSAPADSILLRRVKEISIDADDDEQPTTETIHRALETVMRLQPEIDEVPSFVDAAVFPMNRSIRIEWQNGLKIVNLTIPALSSSQTYLYYHSEIPGIKKNPTKLDLAKWMKWLSTSSDNIA